MSFIYALLAGLNLVAGRDLFARWIMIRFKLDINKNGIMAQSDTCNMPVFGWNYKQVNMYKMV